MKRFDQINMIPFIDIMLVLLAIVLTTASFVSQGLIPVNLPTAAQVSAPSNDAEPLEIAINAQNELFLGTEKMTLEQLGAKLSVQAKPETLIVLRIDKATVFEHFVKLIDLLKARELNNLSIQAQQE
ncbi:MAG: TonB system transport protein ExbD [Thiothrix lacustris]|uniref:Biopolymer transport protein ExbD n=1 Tax=Thiothrix lacustris TaxID=525917 RepID=A0A1Y1QN12_9GAMM|nr:MAG: TonB system transport protein ExbD [Thiothrix lacustris]